jgi:putative hydrolase of the HAD superfamily
VSIVAEFARALHEREGARTPGALEPYPLAGAGTKLYDVKAAVIDVYGTLINYWRPEFAEDERKKAHLLEVFGATAERFGMTPFLEKINPADPPAKTLRDFYHGLIALNHEKALGKGVAYPEVKIERIWMIIILMLRRHGYDPAAPGLGEEADVARCMAFFYNFHSLGRALYPGVVDALVELRKNNIRLGIVSNAQFYTPIDLTLLMRDQSGDRIDDYLELFDTDLVFYSYEYGYSKPNQLLFRKLFDALYELHILPQQTVFIGNDLRIDIEPARDAGMLTAFFSGDRHAAFVHDLEGAVTPDIAFTAWRELPRLLSFYEEKPDRRGSA